MLRILLPIAAVMIPVGAWMAFYNLRVTGNSLLLPYVVHERQYASASAFAWQKPKTPPVYRHEALRQAWIDFDLQRKLFQREHFFVTRPLFYAALVKFYLGLPLFCLILVSAASLARSRRVAAAFWLAIFFLP